MDSLKRYKKLSIEDKNNLTYYEIYNSIYTISKNNNYEIKDDEVNEIAALSYYVYLKDEYYNLSAARISDYLTECYVGHNISLEKLGNEHWSDLLEAAESDNFDYFKDEEQERE